MPSEPTATLPQGSSSGRSLVKTLPYQGQRDTAEGDLAMIVSSSAVKRLSDDHRGFFLGLLWRNGHILRDAQRGARTIDGA